MIVLSLLLFFSPLGLVPEAACRLNAGQVPALLNEKKEEKRVEDGEYFELHSPKYCPPSPGIL